MASIVLLRSRFAQAPTAPDSIAEAGKDLFEFQRNTGFRQRDRRQSSLPGSRMSLTVFLDSDPMGIRIKLKQVIERSFRTDRRPC